jgi:hypothetical protein
METIQHAERRISASFICSPGNQSDAIFFSDEEQVAGHQIVAVTK